MPFIKPERRDLAGQAKLPDTQVGDRCYFFYKQMVDMWKKDPRWTTAHAIYKLTLHQTHMTHVGNLACDDCVARSLAWQVFFQKYIMPYENTKEIENGTI
jgi:hypothetical protein